MPLGHQLLAYFLAVDLICTMWDLTRSCFSHLNGPQQARVLGCVVDRFSGQTLQCEITLLSTLLYGDDTTQAQNDVLLSCLANTTPGEYCFWASGSRSRTGCTNVM